MSTNKFEWKSFLKKLAVIAIPVAIQNLLTTTGSMIDTIMIAPLGENTVGAIGLCAQFSSLMFACYWGFVGGGMMFFSQYWGARDDKGINRSYGTTVVCMMTVGIIFASLALFAPSLIMSIYTDKPAIQEIGIEYLGIIGISYIFTVYSTVMSALLRSTERVKIPLIAAVVSVLSNIFLNWVFIYGNLGVPELGVRGAAIATTCASVINASLILILSKLSGYKYLFMLREHFRWNRKWLQTYLKKCFPIICNEVLIGVGNMVINIVLGRQSEEAIAAIAVFRTLEGLIIGFFAGFSNAASVLVGKCVGAGELKKAYERAKRLVYICAMVIMLLCLTLFVLHKPILTTMSLSGESYDIGTVILGIFCIVAIIRMSNWIQNDTYRSAGDATYGTGLEIVFMYLVVLPCVCISGLVIKAPFFIIFICCYVDEPIRLILMQRHMYSGKWIKPVTPQGCAALEEFRRERGQRDVSSVMEE